MRKAIIFITLFAFATPLLAGPHGQERSASSASDEGGKHSKAERKAKQAENKAFRESLKGLSKEEKATKRATRRSEKAAHQAK